MKDIERKLELQTFRIMLVLALMATAIAIWGASV